MMKFKKEYEMTVDKKNMHNVLKAKTSNCMSDYTETLTRFEEDRSYYIVKEYHKGFMTHKSYFVYVKDESGFSRYQHYMMNFYGRYTGDISRNIGKDTI